MTEPTRHNADLTVVIATKNSEQYFDQCLESVTSQTVQPREIIVIDAHSTDRTEEIARSHSNVRFQKQSGQGLANAWNQGLQLVSSEFTAMIDSDDFWDKGFLGNCVQALAENPEALLAVSYSKFLIEAGHLPRGFRPELIGVEDIGWMPGSTVFRTQIFDVVGYFPEDLVIATDIEWFSRIRQLDVPHVKVPKPGLYKRMHGENFSLDPEYSDQYRSEILKVARNNIKGSSRGLTD